MTPASRTLLLIRHVDNLREQRRVVAQRRELCAPLDAELDALLEEGERIMRALEEPVELERVRA